MYAVIQSGGKQLRVEPGQTVRLEKIRAEVGAGIELGEVLLIGGEGETRIGQPLIEGAKVRGTVVSQSRARKIMVFHYKAKKNVRKRHGHRQPFTVVRIDGIEDGKVEG